VAHPGTNKPSVNDTATAFRSFIEPTPLFHC
jgi:hypothetical protein